MSDNSKLILGNENALAAFNRIRQKHGFGQKVQKTSRFDKENERTSTVIDVEKIEKVALAEIPKQIINEAVKNDRVFDILQFIDEQNFSNNIKAALGIILSGEGSEIGKAIEYLEKELEK
jgi:hypothetical protein